MSSIRDSGNAARVADEVKQSKCKDGGAHDWEKHGSWPSTWGKCKKCGATYFSK